MHCYAFPPTPVSLEWKPRLSPKHLSLLPTSTSGALYSQSPSRNFPFATKFIINCIRQGYYVPYVKPRAPFQVFAQAGPTKPLKVIMSGAPASGKGTQCELIANKYGLVHISVGDLLRSEVAANTSNGRKAKEYMEKGLLVPDEIVTKMVKDRLTQEDAQENGWLLDGYPRSLSQAKVLEEMQVQPDIFLLLEVPNEILVERVVGRRLDPVTGKIYHLKYSPPENKQIAERLTQRFDDTEDKAMSRLETYREYTEDILSVYNDRTQKIDGNRPKELVFEEIAKILNNLLEKDERLSNTRMSKEDQKISFKNKWEGIPTRLNNIPHSREIRQYFYEDVCAATIRAVEDGITRLKIDIGIPELNPNTDVFRIGTLMELVREIALHFAYDGRYVKVCVQNPMGEGALVGMPLQLAGTRRILEFMDWGEHGALGTFVKIGSIGAREVTDEDDMFILVAPQNAVGNCIIYDLQAMSDAAGSRPVLLVNPRLKDIPSAGGVMQTIGREKRMDFANSFLSCYLFRLLYQAGTQYPIMGAIRMCYPSDYELYKRVDTGPGKEKYIKTATFSNEPTPTQIEDAFSGRRRDKESKPGGLWGLLSSIL